MTPADLLTTLEGAPSDLPLIFHLHDRDITGGYHVTEWKVSDVRSIDCGGRMDGWTDAALQLLDGTGGPHMRVGIFAGILRKSIAALPNMAAAQMHVEYGPGNRDLMRLSPAPPQIAQDAVRIALGAATALCKPEAERRVVQDTASCCGTAAPACCG